MPDMPHQPGLPMGFGSIGPRDCEVSADIHAMVARLEARRACDGRQPRLPGIPEFAPEPKPQPETSD